MDSLESPLADLKKTKISCIGGIALAHVFCRQMLLAVEHDSVVIRIVPGFVDPVSTEASTALSVKSRNASTLDLKVSFQDLSAWPWSVVIWVLSEYPGVVLEDEEEEEDMFNTGGWRCGAVCVLYFIAGTAQHKTFPQIDTHQHFYKSSKLQKNVYTKACIGTLTVDQSTYIW